MKNKALVKNAADSKQVKEASVNQKFSREDELEDLRFLLATAQGRRFFWRLFEATHQFTTSFTGNSQTFFYEGERNVGLKILSDIMEADSESYVLMIKEANGHHLKKGN